MGSFITIRDKQFTTYIPQQQLQEAVLRIAGRINEDLKGETPLFIVVLNGAFMFAADLLKEVSIPCGISFVKLASYEGTDSSGKVCELIGLSEDISGRTVVIVEDIVDTGLTIDNLIKILKEKNAKDIRIATALMKKEVYKRDHKIDYVGVEIGNKFVVGYGLDYDGHGRNLKEIYVLV